MKIDPNLLPEFKAFMRERLAAAVPVPVALDVAETKALIETVKVMMQSAQWPILADVASRAESDIIDTIEFDADELLELDDFEQPFYEDFLRSRHRPTG